MSAQKLADESGLTRSVIVNIELGRREDIAWKELLAIAIALRLTPLALVLPIERPFERHGEWSMTTHSFRRWIAGEVAWPGAPEGSVAVHRLISTTDQLEQAWMRVYGSVRALASHLTENQVRVILAGGEVQAPTSEIVDNLIAGLPYARSNYDFLNEIFEREGGVPREDDPVEAALMAGFGDGVDQATS